MSDMVNHPIHYTQGDIECIDCIKAATVGKNGVQSFCVGNIIKYLFRYEKKNGLEDVKKAQFYINRLIQELEQKKENYSLPDPNSDIGDCTDCANFSMDEDSDQCLRCKNAVSPRDS